LRNDWSLGLAAPVSEVTQSAGSLTALMLEIMGISLPLIGLAAFLTVRHITVPLHKLTESAQRMSSGDYSHPVSSRILDRNDEVGKLGRAVQVMGTSMSQCICDSPHHTKLPGNETGTTPRKPADL